MRKQVIRTERAPQSPYFSQGIKVGSFVYVSGMLGIDPRTGKLAGASIQEQTRQAIQNCRSILEEAGAALENVVEVQVLLTNREDFAGMNEEYTKHFRADPPTRSAALIGATVPDALVSLRMTAVA